MSPDGLIDSYVSDVVRLLPRAQRADIRLELKMLLAEELAEIRSAAPESDSERQVLELIGRFGRPAEVAARYRSSVTTVVDPVDRGRFWTAAAVIVLLAVANAQHRPDASVLCVLRDLWTVSLLESALWLGLLAAGFAAAAWVRRRWPSRIAWTPRRMGRVGIGRIGAIAGLVAGIAGAILLVDPLLLFGGRATPAAQQAFAYDEDFTHVRGPLVLALLVGRLALQVVLVVRGRWSATTRRIDVGLALAICAALIWTVLAGPVFQAPPTDQFVKAVLTVIVGGALIGVGRQLRRPELSIMGLAAPKRHDQGVNHMIDAG